MNGPLLGMRSALGFLTILPVAPRDAGGLASARGWFPAVGLLLGLILACLDLLMQWGYPLFSDEYRQFPPALSASILVVALAVLTRALHLDGFMDCCDALFGGFDRERRLSILRDSHVGAFAVVGAVSLLLLKVAAIMALPAPVRFWILLLFPCLSRWGMLLVLEFFPYARTQGIGVPFQPSAAPSDRRGARWRSVPEAGINRGQLLGGLVVAVAATVALAGPGGLALLAIATVVAVGLASWAARLLGGVTGDVYGAVNEAVEATVLVLAAIMAHAISGDFLRPVHMWSW